MVELVKCLICDSVTHEKFKSTVLGKYTVTYFQCTFCEYIQTEKPYWLDEAYSKVIASMDVGLVDRNLQFSKEASKIIKKHFDKFGKFLDFAGGYGLFVRLMRDQGFDFYRDERFCENIFADHLDRVDLPANTRFELITALEVFEHMTDPLNEIKALFGVSDSILFSTMLVPKNVKAADDWWYFVPETGQHVGLFNRKSLGVLANKLDCHIHSNGKDLHLFTKKKMPFPFAERKDKKRSFLTRAYSKVLRMVETKKPKLECLISRDFEAAKARAFKPGKK